MAAIAYTTTRGAACKLTAAESGGWRDTTGAYISAYPSHGNWYYVLILDINLTTITDLRNINRTNDLGLTLTPTGNGYAALAKGRGNTNFTVTEDDIAHQGLCTCPTATWNASGTGIQARYLAKCDGDPVPASVNIIDLFDLGGLQTALAGTPFTIPNIATRGKA